VNHDEVFQSTASRGADFVFDEKVVEVFDDMLVRSVPFYQEQQFMIREMGRRFWLPDTRVYDLGCSTATTLINLSQVLGPSARLIGYDNSVPMLQEAKARIEEKGLSGRVEVLPGDLNGDLSQLPLENASVVVMCWTLQFIRPMHRDRLIRWIHDGLVSDGVLVVTDKVLSGSGHMNRFFIEFYYDFKRRNGYSENEITRKREALENVLIPYRADEDLELFRRNGFGTAEIFFQWYKFAGFLCMKKSA
jgi:tRNA (cmo5U34)-methyltransferase